MKKKIYVFYFFILLLTPWILEILVINLKSNLQSKSLPLPFEKSLQISNERNEKIIFFLKNNYSPMYYVNAGIEYTDYYLNLLNKYKFIPVGSFPNKKTFFCDEGYGFINFETDHLGLRNPKDEWSKSYPYDIIIIGDSYIHGACVNNNKDISGILRRNGRQVLNLGLGDNQPIQYYYLIEKFSKPKPPRNLVVAFYGGNDFYPSKYKDFYLNLQKNEGISFSKKHDLHMLGDNAVKFYDELNYINRLEIESYIQKKGNKNKNESANIKSIIQLKNIREILFNKYSIIISKKLLCYQDRCLTGSVEEHFFGDVKLVISSLIKNCNPTNDCNPIVAFIPSSTLWKPGKIHETNKKIFDKILQNTIKENNFLIYYDSGKYIDKKDLKNYAPAGGHFSEKAYKLFAKNLEKYLK